MKYSIGDTFFFEETNIRKQIIDFEKIHSKIIYYMDDISSYSEDQLDNLISGNNEKKLYDSKNIFERIYSDRFKIIQEYDRIMKQIINLPTNS